jgi:signal transduction histidine kinase
MKPQVTPPKLRLLAPQSLAGTPAGLALEIACLFMLLALCWSDLNTPINVTVSAVAVFPVLAAAWWLSLRATVGVTVVGVLLQILLYSVASIDWHDAAADIAAMLLMAVIGRFAARNWTAMRAGLDRERSLRDELQRLALVEDRERISQELHDGVIQSLFAIGLDLEAAKSNPRLDRSDAIRRSITEINHVIRDLRGYIYGLTPSLLYERDLRSALLKLAEDFTAKVKITVTASVDPAVADMLAPHSVQLIQFATEALANVARHSASTSCSLTLKREGDRAVLEIRDNGVGFDIDQASRMGIGLHSLHERAAQLGGKLAIESAAGHGTSLRLAVPLTPDPLPAQSEPGSRV